MFFFSSNEDPLPDDICMHVLYMQYFLLICSFYTGLGEYGLLAVATVNKQVKMCENPLPISQNVICMMCVCVLYVCVCVCRRLCVLLKIIVPGVFTAEVGKGGVWREAEGLKPPLDAVTLISLTRLRKRDVRVTL